MGVFIQNKNDFDLMKEKICRGDNLIHGGGVDLNEGETIFVFNNYGHQYKIERNELIDWLELQKKSCLSLIRSSKSSSDVPIIIDIVG